MPRGIGAVVRGFWQAAKKLGRAYMAASSLAPNNIRRNIQEEGERKGNLREETARLESFSAQLPGEMGNEAYYLLAPIFTEMQKDTVHSCLALLSDIVDSGSQSLSRTSPVCPSLAFCSLLAFLDP